MSDPVNGGRMEFNASPGPFAHLGPEAATAYDPRAPLDEVDDANSRLMKLYGAHAGEGVSPSAIHILSQFADLQRGERHAEDLIAKAQRVLEGDIYPGATHEGKAQTTAWGSDFGRGYFKWLPKRGVQLPVLRAFARRLEVAQAIIRTRKRQIDRFSRVSRSSDDIGWRLVMHDEGALAGEGIKDEIRWLTKVLECGGREFGASKRRELKRQSMTQFLRFLVDDGLTLDHSCVEMVGLHGVTRGLDSWFVRPSDTFALAAPDYREKLDDGRPVYAFQVLNGRAEIPFGFDELAIFARNTSTWADENGYGYSEFEQSLDTLNNIIQAITFTKQGLNENAVPRGVLLAYGNFDMNTQNAFKAAWAAKVRGVQNQFGVPVLFSRGQQGAVQYLNTGQPFDEMAFSKWISLNMTVMGAIFGVAPEEVGFEGFTADKSSLSGDDTMEKLSAAKDKGLHPLLKDISTFVSDEIVSRFSVNLRLEFTGLDVENSKDRWAEKLKQMTINEVRALFDMPKHPLGWFGDLPADPGMQSAEFQRLQQTATYGEARKMWGGYTSFPSPILEEAPINPSMGALYQSVLSVPPDGGGEGGEGGEGDEGAAGGTPGLGSDITTRLKELSGPSAPFETLDAAKARAGVEE
jgi:hypothetical protein